MIEKRVRLRDQIITLDFLVVFMTMLIFIVGYICTQSYRNVIEDWWYAGMYGNLKYVMYDIVFLIVLWKKKMKIAFWAFLWYSLFSGKDFIQYFIDGNVDNMPDDYILFFTGLVFFAFIYILKLKR